MSLEIEKRFRDFDYKKLKKHFQKLGIKKKGGEIFKVSSFTPTKPNQSIRTRQEGKHTTFTIKEATDSYNKEYEINISNQDMMDEILEKIGIAKKYSLEKFREIYIYNNSELVFDHYPALPPYLEIESKTEEELLDLMKKLDLKDSEFSAKDLYYDLYGISKDRKDDDLLFENVSQKMEKFITKNKKEFDKIILHQLNFIKKYKNRKS